jgi:hypothetical protein
MSEPDDQATGAAASAAPLSWDAFRHHRQAFLDRHQIAAMEEQLDLDPDGEASDFDDDLDGLGVCTDDENENGGWTLLGY